MGLTIVLTIGSVGDEALGKAARSARHEFYQIDAIQWPVHKPKVRRQ